MTDFARQNYRIPNLPTGQIVDETGQPTDDELTFRQTLVTSLQQNFGDEGCVVPSLTQDEITTIQDNTEDNPSDPMSPLYTCQFGTIVYNADTNEIQIAIDDGAGAPIFKTVTLT